MFFHLQLDPGQDTPMTIVFVMTVNCICMKSIAKFWILVHCSCFFVHFALIQLLINCCYKCHVNVVADFNFEQALFGFHPKPK